MKNIVYETSFGLREPVLDVDAARCFALNNRLIVKFKRGNSRVPNELYEKVFDISLLFEDRIVGRIEVETEDYLTDKEKEIMSEWLQHELSDGFKDTFGSEFIERWFADYDANKYEKSYGIAFNSPAVMRDPEEFNSDDYEEDWVVARFDYNDDYELVLI